MPEKNQDLRPLKLKSNITKTSPWPHAWTPQSLRLTILSDWRVDLSRSGLADKLAGNYARCEFWETRPYRVSGPISFQTESVATLKKLQQKETIKRYQFINNTFGHNLKVDMPRATDFRSVGLTVHLTHRVWGYVIFFAVLTCIFQAIF